MQLEMANLQLIAACTVILTTALLYLWRKKPHRKFPPGPIGIPFLGVLPFIDGNLQQAVKDWSERKYGAIMSARLGREDVVFLNTADAIYKVFVKHSSSVSGRPSEGLFYEVDGNFGITSKDYSDDFKLQKRFGLKTMRESFFGGKPMGEAVNEEADLFLDFLSSKVGTSINIAIYFKRFAANVVARLVCNTRYDYEDNSSENITALIEKSNQKDGILLLCVFFNALHHLPPFSIAFKKYLKMQQVVYDAFDKIINEHENKLDTNNRKDFIDEFLFEQQQENTEGNTSFTRKQLIMYSRGLFIAGTETTSITLSWCILALLHYPHLKKDMIQEINNMLDNRGNVAASVKWDMPCVNSFISEVLRYRPVGPFSVPHKVTNTVNVDEFVIPKGTTVFSNIYAAHHDPNTWPEPHLFRPQRFLREDGSFDTKKKLSSFGVGPRWCIGESLARLEMFVLFTKLLQTFKFHPGDCRNLPSMHDAYTSTLFYGPKEFEVVLERRSC